MLSLSLDGNKDHVVSAKEFRSWLFPQNMSSTVFVGEGSTRDNTEFMNVLLHVLQEQYNGDIVAFFESLKTSRSGEISSNEIKSGLETHGVHLSAFQMNLLEKFCTSDGKITLQSLDHALDCWKNQRGGAVMSQVALLNEQSRLLVSNGAGSSIKGETELYKESQKKATRPLQELSDSSPELTYTDVAKMFRNSLLSDASDISDAKKKLQNIFNSLDTDHNGIITTSELRLLLEQLGIAKLTENPGRTMDLLIEQIDVNRDGAVNLQELETFLWPSKEKEGDEIEYGLILNKTRQALFRAVGPAAFAGSADGLLSAFADLANIKLRPGGVLNVRHLKQAFHALDIDDIGKLSDNHIRLLTLSLDGGSKGVVSANEFKAWLIPQQVNASIAWDKGETLKNNEVMTVVFNLVKKKCNGSVASFFNQLDTHRNGQLSSKELMDGLDYFNCHLTASQVNLMTDLLRASDGKITFQSVSRAIELWKNQREGQVSSQMSILHQHHKDLSKGVSFTNIDALKRAASVEDEEPDIFDDPLGGTVESDGPMPRLDIPTADKALRKPDSINSRDRKNQKRTYAYNYGETEHSRQVKEARRSREMSRSVDSMDSDLQARPPFAPSKVNKETYSPYSRYEKVEYFSTKPTKQKQNGGSLMKSVIKDHLEKKSRLLSQIRSEAGGNSQTSVGEQMPGVQGTSISAGSASKTAPRSKAHVAYPRIAHNGDVVLKTNIPFSSNIKYHKPRNPTDTDTIPNTESSKLFEVAIQHRTSNSASGALKSSPKTVITNTTATADTLKTKHFNAESSNAVNDDKIHIDNSIYSIIAGVPDSLEIEEELNGNHTVYKINDQSDFESEVENVHGPLGVSSTRSMLKEKGPQPANREMHQSLRGRSTSRRNDLKGPFIRASSHDGIFLRNAINSSETIQQQIENIKRPIEKEIYKLKKQLEVTIHFSP